jgi:acyl-CoA synthetase (AMP-forming)/AMP-acid ligase II
VTNILQSTNEIPDGVAVICEDQTLTWSQLETNARKIAHALTQWGLATGDRWALLSHNRIEWTELFLGNTIAGTRYVPLNWHLTAPELEYLLINSGATALIVDPEHAAIGIDAAVRVGIAPERIIVMGRSTTPGETLSPTLTTRTPSLGRLSFTRVAQQAHPRVSHGLIRALLCHLGRREFPPGAVMSGCQTRASH